MTELTKRKATICIVNYKTLDFTRLCLRSIRKFTSYPYEVLVIDNDSQDASQEYLESLNWIRLIGRKDTNDPSGGYAHGAALDLGLANCRTEIFVSMHSDTFVQSPNWLSELMRYMEGNPTVACVGTDKIELTPKWRTALKEATDFRTFARKLLRTPDPTGKHRYYNRTICCLYRTEILHREHLSFLMDRGKGLTSGKQLYFELVDRGYKTVELPPEWMKQYVVHLAHTTQAVNPGEFTLRKHTLKKHGRTLDKIMSSDVMQSILNDDSLDR